jgi:hypothetical protein
MRRTPLFAAIAVAMASIARAFTDLETAWPTIMPPDRPAKPRTVLHGFVSFVELHANRLR